MTTAERIAKIATKCHSEYQVTKLWNWIDKQDNPEEPWAALMSVAGFAFDDDRDSNSIRFSYARC